MWAFEQFSDQITIRVCWLYYRGRTRGVRRIMDKPYHRQGGQGHCTAIARAEAQASTPKSHHATRLGIINCSCRNLAMQGLPRALHFLQIIAKFILATAADAVLAVVARRAGAGIADHPLAIRAHMFCVLHTHTDAPCQVEKVFFDWHPRVVMVSPVMCVLCTSVAQVAEQRNEITRRAAPLQPEPTITLNESMQNGSSPTHTQHVKRQLTPAKP